MKFTESHEWVDLNSDQTVAIVGVTDHAQKELGEIVYVELPEVGKSVHAGAEAAVLESTKAAADVYSPVSGTIVAINEELSNHPEKVNKSPEKEGWIFKVKMNNLSEMKDLLSREQYQAMLK